MLEILRDKKIFNDEAHAKNSKKNQKPIKPEGAEMFESYYEIMENFCGDIDYELNTELDDLLNKEKLPNMNGNALIELLDTVGAYIECDVSYHDFLPLDCDNLKHMCFVHIKPIGMSLDCPAIVTGIGSSTISKQQARCKAAHNALKLLNKIRKCKQ